jgi:hypothetical protein
MNAERDILMGVVVEHSIVNLLLVLLDMGWDIPAMQAGDVLLIAFLFLILAEQLFAEMLIMELADKLVVEIAVADKPALAEFVLFLWKCLLGKSDDWLPGLIAKVLFPKREYCCDYSIITTMLFQILFIIEEEHTVASLEVQ